MTEKELQAIRNKPQVFNNILDKDFEYRWDGIDYLIEKGGTDTQPFYLAEHAAFHMAREYCLLKKLNFHREGGRVVDDIMGKKFIEYNKLTLKEAVELAKERKLKIEDDNGNKKNKKDLIADLKATH